MFNIDVNVEVVVTERLFPFDLNKHPERMESLLEHRLKKENEALVEKLQKHQVDPLGLGVYAREYPYDAWNKEQDDWGKALSRARITVSPQVEIRNFGRNHVSDPPIGRGVTSLITILFGWGLIHGFRPASAIGRAIPGSVIGGELV